MEELIEILKEWSDLIIGSGLAMTLISSIKLWFNNKKLKKTIDIQQDKELLYLKDKSEKDAIEHNVIMKKLTFLYDNAKNSIFHQTIKKELRKQLNNIIKINKIENNEFHRLLTNIISSYLYSVKDILLYDFVIDIEELSEIIGNNLDNTVELINPTKLGLELPNEFITEMMNLILYPSINAYILSYTNLQCLENGERRNELNNLSMSYNITIINEIIKLYNTKIKIKCNKEL